MIKRIISVVMVLLLAVSVAACGSENNESTTTTAKKTEQATSGTLISTTVASHTVAVTSKKTVSTYPVKWSTTGKLITRTTNKKGNASKAFVNSLKGYSLKIMYPWGVLQKGTTLGDSNLACIKQVEDEYGVKITESGQFEQYNENLTAKLASRKAENQIYMVQSFNFASYFKNGYMSDLTSAMNKAGVDFKDPWYVQDANAFFNINYRQYGWIPFDAEYVFPFCILYNKTLINKAKLTDPATLAKNGKWTWDTLESYAKKLTTPKIIGFGTVSATVMLEEMAAQKNARLVSVKKGKSPSTNITNQTVKETLKKVADWCKNDKLCNTFAGKDWTYGKTQFAAGKVALMFGGHDTAQILKTNAASDDDFGIVQFPTPTPSKNFINVTQPSFLCFIPSQHQAESAKALFVRNEMYRYNYVYAQRDFQVQWGEYFDDDDVLSIACNIKYARGNNKTVFSWLPVCEKSDAKTSTSSIINYVIANNGAVQTGIDKYKSALEKCYSDMWTGYIITGNV